MCAQLILGPAGSGKTRSLIGISEFSKCPIVLGTEKERERVKEFAKQLGKSNIPEPINANFAINGRTVGLKGGLLVDNASHVLSVLLGQEVRAMTETYNKDMHSGKLDEFMSYQQYVLKLSLSMLNDNSDSNNIKAVIALLQTLIEHDGGK